MTLRRLGKLTTSREPVQGRSSAWIGFTVGIVASIAANVLHAMESTWTYPELVGAAFWPTALLISVEVLTRVAWPHGWQWVITRFAGVVIVAFVAAALSYLHMRSLLLTWGEGPFQATVGPAAVDGLMLISATALLAISRTAAEPVAETATADEQEVLAAELDQGVEDAVPVLPEVPARPVRIGPLRRPRRPGRVAGRRAHTHRPEPVLEAAPIHPAPPPPLEQKPAAALNGAPHPRVSAPTKPKTTPKRSQRNKTAGTRVDDDHALQVWRSELAAGRSPSAQQFADLLGVSKATASRAQNRLQPRLNEAHS